MIQTYGTKELVPILKRKEKTIRNYILDKKLKASYIGNRYIVTESDVEEFILQNRVFKYENE